jgi:hypothetical protein
MVHLQQHVQDVQLKPDSNISEQKHQSKGNSNFRKNITNPKREWKQTN